MSWAVHERAAFTEACVQFGPDAPTLCEGWTVADLAAHCYVRERRPDAALGVLPLGPLSAYNARVMNSALRTLGFDEIVSRLRVVPPWVRPVDALINTVEYFVHTEDIRRDNGQGPRDMPEDFERVVWRRMSKQARLSFRRAGVRVRLVPTVGEPVEAGRGSGGNGDRAGSGEVVVVSGKPSELLLLAFNRTSAAEVSYEGPPDAVAALKAAHLGM